MATTIWNTLRQWLLMAHDWIDGDESLIAQEFPGVTVVAGILQSAGRFMRVAACNFAQTASASLRSFGEKHHACLESRLVDTRLTFNKIRAPLAGR
jgi:hypothetical protein